MNSCKCLFGESLVFLSLKFGSFCSLRTGLCLRFESSFLSLTCGLFCFFFGHKSRPSCFLLLLQLSDCSSDSSINGLLGARVLRSCSFGGGRILLSLVVRLSQSGFLLDENFTGLLVRCSLVGKCLGLSLGSLDFCEMRIIFLLLSCLCRSRLGCVLGRLCSS